MKIKTISLILLAIGLCSCERIDRPEPEEPHAQERQSYETEYGTFDLSEGTIYLTDTGNGGISIIDASTLSVKKGAITDEQKAKVGDICLYTRTGDNPQGLLGRVDSVSDEGDSWVFHTSPVNLDEVFDEIHLEGDLKLSGKDGTYLDENGEPVSYSVVDNSIWDTLDEYEMIEEESPTPTKSPAATKGVNAEEQTFEFKIKAGENVEGTIYLGLGIHANIHKENGGKLECNFSITTRIGAKASLTLKEFEKKIPFLTVKKLLPMDIVVGPLILTPEIMIEEGIRPFAKASLESDLKMELFNTVFDAGFYDGAPHFSFGSGPKADSYFKVLSLEGSAGISLYTNISVEIATYGIRDILSVGVEGGDECNFNFIRGSVSLTNKDLLELGLDVNVEKSKTVGAYVHSQAFKLFGAEDGKFSASKSFSTSADMGIFPEHIDNTTKKINSGIRATASGVKKGLTSVVEHGFALFHKGKPVEHKNLAEAETKASSTELSAEFTIPDDNAEYFVKEYVKVKNSDGEHYFYKGHPHAIDLGLSVKWACCNVGAINPEEHGGYYAWGEIVEKDYYEDDSYMYCSPQITWIDTNGDGATEKCIEYIYQDIGNNISNTEYDVAYMQWGENWRMPTASELQELIQNCSWNEMTLDGVKGYVATSKVEGFTSNSIFFPFSGFKRGIEFLETGLVGVYMTSTCDKDYDKCFIGVDIESGYGPDMSGGFFRKYGACVRPVFIEEKKSK